MWTFWLWLVLRVVGGLLAWLALGLCALGWLVGLRLRLVGVSVRAVLDLFMAIIGLPARVLRGAKGVRS